MDWLNQVTIIEAGEVVVAIASLTVLLVVLRGYRDVTKQFTKILGNHLHDAHKDKQEEIKSRDKQTKMFTKLCEKIDNLK